MNCTWCNGEFKALVMGGHEKRFCSGNCRRLFHKALRKWGWSAFQKGNVSIDTLRSFSSYTTATMGNSGKKVA